MKRFVLAIALLGLVSGCTRYAPIYDPPPRPNPTPIPNPTPNPDPSPADTDAPYSKLIELKTLVEAGNGSVSDSDKLLGKRYSERVSLSEPYDFVVEYHAKNEAGTGKLNVYVHAKSKIDLRIESIGVR